MKLLTKAILKKLPALYHNEHKEPADIPVIVKYFDPTGRGTWYATEYDGEDTFFGLCTLFEPELGYFSLSELQNTRGRFGLGIERDRHLPKGFTLSDAMKREGYNWTLASKVPAE